MMISASVALDLQTPVRDFDIGLTAMDTSDKLESLRSVTVGWNVPLTLNKQDWQDFLFYMTRDEGSFYGSLLGFYVRYLGDAD